MKQLQKKLESNYVKKIQKRVCSLKDVNENILSVISLKLITYLESDGIEFFNSQVDKYNYYAKFYNHKELETFADYQRNYKLRNFLK